MKPCHTDLITYKRVNRNFESMPEANELQTTQVYIMTLMRLGEMAWGNQNNINIDWCELINCRIYGDKLLMKRKIRSELS